MEGVKLGGREDGRGEIGWKGGWKGGNWVEGRMEGGREWVKSR